MQCKCGREIPQERLDAIKTNVCVTCAATEGAGRVGFMVYSHKTAPELIMISTNDRQGLDIAQRAHRRSR